MKPAFDLDKIAALSGISVSESEREALLSDMAEMVSFAERLADGGDCASAPYYLPHDEINVLREDIPSCSTPREALLAATSSVTGGYISVPRVIGGDTNEA